MLEGALRCGVCPGTLAGQRLDATTGRAEHCDLDGLACCIEISGDVEQVLSGGGHDGWLLTWLLYSVWGQASSAQHQVGDLINLIHSAAGAHPLVSTTADGHSPDHALLTPELSDALGVVERGCPPASVLIEVAPVSGLDSEGHEVISFGMWLL